MKTLEQLADQVDAVVHGDAKKKLFAVASLATANANQIAFFDNPAKLKWLESTNAGAVVLTPQYINYCPTNALIVSDPALIIAKLQTSFDTHTSDRANIHPNAILSLTCEIGQNVTIGPNACIGERVQIGDNVHIGAGCVIECDVVIGADTTIHHTAVIHQNVTIGRAVKIDGGSVIGALPYNGVKSNGVWHQGPAFGSVVIEDNVHIGANTVLDRGGYSDTVIGQGVTIDNLVQIAHDTLIGPNTAIAGCAAIGANCVIGAHCVIGGASTIAANISLCDDVVITGMSTVNKSLKKSGIYSSGTMVSDHQSWRKNVARFRQLENWVDRVKSLEKLYQVWVEKKNHVSE